MKRIVLWFMSTLTALVLLFGYKTSTSASTLDSANSVSLAPITISSTPSPAASSSSSAAKTSASGTGSAKTSTSTTTKAATVPAKKTIVGPVVETQWGPVQVQLSVISGKITAVTVLQHPTGGRSDEINAAALPILINETLKSQNAKIDMVSGATYTSTGYIESLQSALDKAGL